MNSRSLLQEKHEIVSKQIEDAEGNLKELNETRAEKFLEIRRREKAIMAEQTQITDDLRELVVPYTIHHHIGPTMYLLTKLSRIVTLGPSQED